MSLKGEGVGEEFLAARTEQPLRFHLGQVSAVRVLDHVPGGRAGHVTELAVHAWKNPLLHLLLLYMSSTFS